MKEKFPVWLTVIVIIETLPMFMGPMLAIFKPEATPIMEFGIDSPSGAWLYAARNIAVGIALITAFLLRSYSMLFALILVRFITDLIDLPNGLYFNMFANNPQLVIFIFVAFYYLPALYAMQYCWKKSTGKI